MRVITQKEVNTSLFSQKQCFRMFSQKCIFCQIVAWLCPHSDSKSWTLWSRVSSWLREPSSSLTHPMSIHRWVVFVQMMVKSKVHPSAGGVLLIGDHPGIGACLFCQLWGRRLSKLSSLVQQQMIKPKSQDVLSYASCQTFFFKNHRKKCKKHYLS